MDARPEWDGYSQHMQCTPTRSRRCVPLWSTLRCRERSRYSAHRSWFNLSVGCCCAGQTLDSCITSPLSVSRLSFSATQHELMELTEHSQTGTVKNAQRAPDSSSVATALFPGVGPYASLHTQKTPQARDLANPLQPHGAQMTVRPTRASTDPLSGDAPVEQSVPRPGRQESLTLSSSDTSASDLSLLGGMRRTASASSHESAPEDPLPDVVKSRSHKELSLELAQKRAGSARKALTPSARSYRPPVFLR